MKAGDILILGAVGVGAWWLANIGIAAKTVNFVFVGVKFNSLTDLVATIRVQNVSNASLQVNSMAGEVFLNGIDIANVNDFTKHVVEANAQTDIQVHIRPDLMSLPDTAYQAFISKSGDFNWHVEGNVNVNGAVIPFSLDKTASL